MHCFTDTLNENIEKFLQVVESFGHWPLESPKSNSFEWQKAAKNFKEFGLTTNFVASLTMEMESLTKIFTIKVTQT